MTGSLQIKSGKYYAVLFYKDKTGKSCHKWISTGFEEKGNKKRAEQRLSEILENFDEKSLLEEKIIKSKEKLFSEYLQDWLQSIKTTIEEISFHSYQINVKVISKYFDEKKITLKELKPYDIQAFYNMLYERGSTANNVLHYHVVIKKALDNAVKLELINKNPTDFLTRPKIEKYHAEYYNKTELKQLFEVIKGDPLELIINITAYYGLRRSEVLGLKWSAIDFVNKMIKINHKVVEINGKIIAKNKMKNKSSNRALPLVPHIEKMLLIEKARQEQNQKDFGQSYNHAYDDYVNVNPLGNLILPNFPTQHFRVIQSKYNLKRIRFHDLRHSCASLMLASGISMKQIQDWLGHSTFQVTADTYSHLDFASKISSAHTISEALKLHLFSENDEIEKELTDEEIDKQIAELEKMKARKAIKNIN